MAQRFSDRVILVSGAARGMGAAHVRAFAAEGGRVIIADRRYDEAQKVARDIGKHAVACELDVTDFAEWQAAVTLAEERFGAVDVLVNNAGVLLNGTVIDESPERFRTIVETNMTGVFLGMRAVAAGMVAKKRGAIVNIASAAGLIAYPASIGYVAAKWGVRGMTKSAAMDFARTGVRVNCVCPGPTQTPMVGGMVDSSFVANQAVPRWSQPEEVSRLVLFLASDEAAYCTGGDYAIDGGASLGIVPSPVTID